MGNIIIKNIISDKVTFSDGIKYLFVDSDLDFVKKDITVNAPNKNVRRKVRALIPIISQPA